MPLTTPEVRHRRRARARVIQALYAWDLAPHGSLMRTADRVWDDLAVSADDREFARPIIAILDEHLSEIDAELTDVADNWRLERMGVIDRSVLRMAAAELRRGFTPARAVMQEAVTLAERFGSSRSARFVNGVIDAYARRHGAL
jgi:N utilization substance protein B